MASKAKKKYANTAEVARAIGLNYYGLSLLKYLKDYHPDLSLDYDFIMHRADMGSQCAADYVMSHGTDAMSQCEANNLAHQLMTEGLEFSEHDIIFNVVDEYYDRTGYARPAEEVRSIAIELRPQLKSVFAKYPTDDPGFPASCAYDDMVARLARKAARLLEKRDELPF
jgi:hypothetical protein